MNRIPQDEKIPIVTSLPMQPASTFRTLREYVGKIAAVFYQIRSWWSSRVFNKEEEPCLQGRVKDLTAALARETNLAENFTSPGARSAAENAEKIRAVLGAIKMLSTRGVDAGNTTIEAVLRNLAEKNSNFSYRIGLIQGTLDLKDAPEMGNPETATLVAVPVVLKGFGKDHIVAFLVDKTNSTIEYYDSKGLTLSDRGNVPLYTVAQEKRLWEILRELAKEYNCSALLENTNKHQWDFYNCGVFVSDFYTRRVGGESFSSLINKSRTQQEIDGSVRKRLIENLLSREGEEMRTPRKPPS